MQVVLLVDDDRSIRHVLRQLLQGSGYLVEEAVDGAPALLRLYDSPERLVVLLDWRMPGIDGLKLLTTVASQPAIAARHAFVLMTADDQDLPHGAQELLRALAVPVLRKPFDLEAALKAVGKASDRLSVTLVPCSTDVSPPGE